MSTYENLAKPIKLGSVELKNRMMKNGTGFFWDSDGAMNDKYIAFFETLAKGGLALAVSACGPMQMGPMPGFRITGDEFIPGWTKWADAIKKHDCLAFHQLFHLGGMSPLFADPMPPAGPSASHIPREQSPRPGFEEAHTISKQELEDVVDLFGTCAERMKKAGLQGTELNAACNHLLDSFMSRAWNFRDDEFGGSVENRAKPTVMVIQEIKRRNGKDWPLILLMNGMEPDLKNGLTLEETIQFAKIYEAAGADAIEVRSEFYTHTNNWKRRSSTHFPDCYFYPDRPAHLDPNLVDDWGRGANINIAGAIKKAVNVPVIVCGKMDWDNGEAAIRDGKADIISMNRRLLADPGAPKKILEGRLDDITPCTSCMTCFNLGEHFKPVACRVNATLGKEREYEIKPAATKKKVLVIGGGPSGMEAARTAALRGHSVVLYDKQKKLGGSMPVAAVIKGMEREDIVGFTQYLRNQMVKTGVTVHTGTEVTAAVIDREKPDAIILAAGGTHEIPAIPGIDSRKVQTGAQLHNKMKFFLKYFSPEFMNKMSKVILPGMGKNVVIMGDRLHGCQTAEFLVHRGRKVTIVDTGSADLVGDGLIEVFLKPFLLYWLEDQGVEIISEAKYNEVTSEGLVITRKDGTRQTIKADTIITALPLKPNSELANKFKGKAKEFYNIGDSQEPALIFDAIAAGAKIGHEI